jgi:hypothetical protein
VADVVTIICGTLWRLSYKSANRCSLLGSFDFSHENARCVNIANPGSVASHYVKIMTSKAIENPSIRQKELSAHLPRLAHFFDVSSPGGISRARNCGSLRILQSARTSLPLPGRHRRPIFWRIEGRPRKVSHLRRTLSRLNDLVSPVLFDAILLPHIR